MAMDVKNVEYIRKILENVLLHYTLYVCPQEITFAVIAVNFYLRGTQEHDLRYINF